jgi:DNA-binding response OmpR family regulator
MLYLSIGDNNFSPQSDSKRQSMSIAPKKYRLMIVDDDEDITKIFKIALERNDFIVTTFNDSREALRNFRPGTYDLLLLDIRMPGMNGFELYQKISEIDDKVKVCFLTAFDEYREKFKMTFPALDEANCYLKKPITITDLIDRLIKLANS